MNRFGKVLFRVLIIITLLLIIFTVILIVSDPKQPSLDTPALPTVIIAPDPPKTTRPVIDVSFLDTTILSTDIETEYVLTEADTLTDITEESITTYLITELDIEVDLTEEVDFAAPTTTTIISADINEADVIILAKILYSECDVVKSETERACVIWTILNRVDKNHTSIEYEVTKPHQFAWNPKAPVQDNHVDLARDVLQRWYTEKETGENCGRVLPKDYCFFYGDGRHNHFYNDWEKKNITWDYSLPSPYES
jgi:hypothetical protein